MALAKEKTMALFSLKLSSVVMTDANDKAQAQQQQQPKQQRGQQLALPSATAWLRPAPTKECKRTIAYCAQPYLT